MIIRTYYVKGLLFYISNSDASAFLAVQLADDQLSIVYSPDMQAVDAVNSSAHVTDGAWHTVSQPIFQSFSWLVGRSVRQQSVNQTVNQSVNQ